MDDNEELETHETNHKKIKKAIKIIAFITIFIIGVLLYSRYIGTSFLQVKEYKIENKKITDDFHGLKIIQLSDVHFGRTIKKKELKNIVNTINSLKPDIVVLTGDLIDKDTKLTKNYEKQIIDCLSKIDVSIKKYAIEGNHDYQFKKWSTIIKESGFINLNDTYDIIYNGTNNFILISGMSTNIHRKKTINEKLKPTTDFLNTLTDEQKNNLYKILIFHEPDFIDKVPISFDLALAGHSHNGQVRLPFVGAIIKPKYGRKYYENYYHLKNTELYVSSGIGTSEINFRLFNHPSINFFRITNN